MTSIRRSIVRGIFAWLWLAWPAAAWSTQIASAPQTDVPGDRCGAIARRDWAAIPESPATVDEAVRVRADGAGPGYCRIRGFIAPQIRFELRLPDDWNGRYLQGGCSGYCGYIPIAACGAAQARGFAVAASNLGHAGGPWALPVWGVDPQLRRDFGGRATHVLAVAAKAIIRSYYGAPVRYSYFQGCSTGGREGLYAAQHHPQDFDGIVAGAPAFAGRLGPLWNNWMARTLMSPDGQAVFSPDDLAFLHASVVETCDASDGLADGIIGDPRVCAFDPDAVRCRGTTRSRCLSQAQVDAARAMYEGAYNDAGVRLFPGGAPYGSELEWNGPLMAQIAQASLRFLSFARVRPDFGYRDFDWTADVADVEAAARVYDPVAPREIPDLEDFRRRGGRMIVYQGLADAGVPPANILDYYAQVWTRNGGLERTRSWFRLFLVPGMAHCGGGRAPNSFDMLDPVIRWVENEEPPDGIVATQFDEADAPQRSRPIFAYPNVARYAGTGDPGDAENWTIRTRSPGDDRIDWIWAPPR